MHISSIDVSVFCLLCLSMSVFFWCLLHVDVVSLFRINFSTLLIIGMNCLQCFDAVGWAAGRASGL